MVHYNKWDRFVTTILVAILIIITGSNFMDKDCLIRAKWGHILRKVEILPGNEEYDTLR